MMVAEIKIERVERKHMEEIINLLQTISIFRPSKDSYSKIWDAFDSQSHVFAIVITKNNLVLGYGSVVIEKKIRGGNVGHVEDVAVSELYKNQGIGKLIMEALYKLAIKEGCYKLILQSRPQNIEFYKKCGYVISGSCMQRFLIE